jgi:hypothetical protein
MVADSSACQPSFATFDRVGRFGLGQRFGQPTRPAPFVKAERAGRHADRLRHLGPGLALTARFRRLRFRQVAGTVPAVTTTSASPATAGTLPFLGVSGDHGFDSLGVTRCLRRREGVALRVRPRHSSSVTGVLEALRGGVGASAARRGPDVPVRPYRPPDPALVRRPCHPPWRRRHTVRLLWCRRRVHGGIRETPCRANTGTSAGVRTTPVPQTGDSARQGLGVP